MFEISSHVRIAGVTLGVRVQGVNHGDRQQLPNPWSRRAVDQRLDASVRRTRRRHRHARMRNAPEVVCRWQITRAGQLGRGERDRRSDRGGVGLSGACGRSLGRTVPNLHHYVGPPILAVLVARMGGTTRWGRFYPYTSHAALAFSTGPRHWLGEGEVLPVATELVPEVSRQWDRANMKQLVGLAAWQGSWVLVPVGCVGVRDPSRPGPRLVSRRSAPCACQVTDAQRWLGPPVSRCLR